MALRKAVQNLLERHTDSDGVFPDLMKFFEFVEMLDYDGAQGKIGILIHKDTKQKVICKIPRYPGFFLRHEHSVMTYLSGSRKFCPSFCEEYGLIRTLISFDNENPFNVSEGATFLSDVLLMEYIPGSLTLTEKAFSKSTYSLIQHALLSVEIGRIKYGLTHYDLHGDNVLLRKCKKNLLCLYKINNRKFILPTGGYIPTIIDFGFSYIKGRDNVPLYSPMSHTDAGYLACLYDPFYDARILLVNMSHDMMETKTPQELSFRNKIMGVYSHIDFHPANGWDTKSEQYSAAETIIFTIYDIEGTKSNSIFFTDGYNAVGILQSLILLPLKNNKNGDFRPYYQDFSKQFRLFEETVNTRFNKLLILSQLVESARKVRSEFTKNPDEAVRVFRRDFSHYIEKSLHFYIPPPEVNYHSLLISMYKMAECIETVYYRVMKDLLEKKKEQYKSPTGNIDLYDLIDTFHPTKYNLSEDSPVVVYDVDNELSMPYEDGFSQKFCDSFNDTPLKERAERMWSELQRIKRASD